MWEQGCTDWETFLAEPERFRVGSASREVVLGSVKRSVEALEQANHQFFQRHLGMAEAWRAWPEFRDRCLYLDIETDGGQSGQSVTLIGLYDGREFKALVKGHDLEQFRDLLSHYSMVVTFFGAGFDIPMLQKRFKDLGFDQIHLDLCFALKRLGYRGGLKKIERQLGIVRADLADGLDGRDAIRLWREHERGSPSALDQLIAYNREDVVNLERLAEIAYKGLSEGTVYGTLGPAVRR